MQNLEKAGYLLQVLQAGSVSKAAENLSMTQPVLSRNLLLLEKEAGTKLYIKNGNKYYLTCAGEAVVHAYRESKTRLNNLSWQLGDAVNGIRTRIVIGMPPKSVLILMPKILPVFRREFPLVDLVINTDNSDAWDEEVMNGDVDLAVEVSDSTFIQYTDSLVYDVLGSYDTLLLVPYSYEIAQNCATVDWRRRPPVDLALFQNEPFTGSVAGTGNYNWSAPVFAAYGFRPRLSVQTTGDNIFSCYPNAACGLSLVGEWLARENCHKVAGRYFRLDKGAFETKQYIIYRKSAYISRPMHYLMDLIVKLMGKQAGWQPVRSAGGRDDD